MTIDLIPKRNNAIVPLNNALKRTKQVDLTVTSTNWTTGRAVGIAYADSNGVWRLRFNITGTFSSSITDETLSIASPTAVIFKSGHYQTLTGYDYSSANNPSTFCRVDGGNGNFRIVVQNSATNFVFSGDLELDSKPPWADANMEGLADISVYVPPASATASGIVTTGAQEIAGVKTFSNTSTVLTLNGTDTGEDAESSLVCQINGSSKSIFGSTNPPSADACGYMMLKSPDGTAHYVWFRNDGLMMMSTDAANIGTSTGTVIGSQS